METTHRANPGRRALVGEAIRNFGINLLADAGVFGTIVASQLVMGAIGGLVILVAWRLNAVPGMSFDRFYDSAVVFSLIAAQGLALAVTLPWWRYIRPASFSCARHGRLSPGLRRVARIAGVVLMGVGFQMLISYVLSVVLPLFPAIESEYDEVMSSGGTDEFTLPAVVALAVGAPISEEVACRGLLLEYSLRAVCPEWIAARRERMGRRRARLPLGDTDGLHVPSIRFWAANLIQAALFGILHMNLVQGLYAFAIGLVLGWVFWRTGRLCYNIGLHLTLNFSSYFVSEVSHALGSFGPVFELASVAVLTVVGILAFIWGSECDSRADGCGAAV